MLNKHQQCKKVSTFYYASGSYHETKVRVLGLWIKTFWWIFHKNSRTFRCEKFISPEHSPDSDHNEFTKFQKKQLSFQLGKIAPRSLASCNFFELFTEFQHHSSTKLFSYTVFIKHSPFLVSKQRGTLILLFFIFLLPGSVEKEIRIVGSCWSGQSPPSNLQVFDLFFSLIYKFWGDPLFCTVWVLPILANGWGPPQNFAAKEHDFGVH